MFTSILKELRIWLTILTMIIGCTDENFYWDKPERAKSAPSPSLASAKQLHCSTSLIAAETLGWNRPVVSAYRIQ